HCQVARAGGYIQNGFGADRGNFLNSFSTPSLIYTQRKKMVEEIVFTGYAVKHIRNLRFLIEVRGSIRHHLRRWILGVVHGHCCKNKGTILLINAVLFML